ncbi:carbohydrate kinase [Silvimonas sp.]|uniref:carbohydrate kinase family protein n=1 Tax=Silvimonas sp. TaxID=2650811 RepID=UPI00284D21E6|nr:carbohydrate kinase [Silvimonas sp.]MDR3427286.1 carbohydrate kinase [Silvimonas sp.]
MNPKFVVFGEALTDFIFEGDGLWRAVPGGSCWNVARVSARLSLATAYAGAVSTDNFGDDLTRLAREAGLDMRFMQQVARPPLLAMVPSKTPPQYFFIGNDSADQHFDVDQLPQGWVDDLEIAHFGCISLVRQPLAAKLVQIAERIKAAGKRICFDPNYRNLMQDPAYRATLQRMSELADYIKVSDEDLEHLFPGETLAGALGVLRQWAPKAWVLLTRGGDGMTLITPQGEVSRGVYKVEVADTVGAGDASMGGWIASLLNNPDAPLETHLNYAAAAAATVCRQHGAYAPTMAEVEALINA